MKLQRTHTTIEQSKRLLALGIPMDTADCAMSNYGAIHVLSDRYSFSAYAKDIYGSIEACPYLPCWSYGALRQIDIICYKWASDDIMQGGVFLERSTIMCPGLGMIGGIIAQWEDFEDKYDFSRINKWL